jgi:hypothetical protein
MYSLAQSFSVSGEKCVVLAATPETKDALNIPYFYQPPAALDFQRLSLSERADATNTRRIFFIRHSRLVIYSS